MTEIFSKEELKAIDGFVDELESLGAKKDKISLYQMGSTMKILKNLCTPAKTILICDAGWGNGLLLAVLAKKFSRFICYDTNPYCGDFIIEYFKRSFGLDILFLKASPADLDFSRESQVSIAGAIIEEKLVILSANSKLRKHHFQQMLDNPIVCAIIKDGVLIK